mmetsp:Transcript_29437/g.64367  ORF Transcript_29437/g.64367 Transcript_29437/m.64367 type:complete len:574 (-) Transcript_29437:76-1797(-)
MDPRCAISAAGRPATIGSRRMGVHGPRQALLAITFVALLPATARSSYAPSQYEYQHETRGCFNYGYKYTPGMQNVTGMPFTLNSALQCQARCAATRGCFYFGYWKRTKECWLGGANAHLTIASTMGAVAGPAVCSKESQACSAIPGPDFPGDTTAMSRSAWPGGEQPTNLQCWPRRSSGFPHRCENRTATVLEDTVAGWPGRCEGLRKITSLRPGETCQLRCMLGPLCGVWVLENTTSVDGSPTCWNGMFGHNCYSGKGPKPIRAQRIMHGSFRVLMNTMGMQIKNLTKAFDSVDFPNWEDGKKNCRLVCLSYILCQYWQYSDVYGCWVEDVLQKRVAYPLIKSEATLATDNAQANTVKAGEYLQHLCPNVPRVQLPTDPPTGGQASKAYRIDVSRPSAHNTLHPAVAGGPTSIHSVAAGVNVATPGYLSAEPEAQAGGWPWWATMLVVLTIIGGLGAIGFAVWMGIVDADKPSSRGISGFGMYRQGQVAPQDGSYGYGGSFAHGGSFDSRASSFDQSGMPLMHPQQQQAQTQHFMQGYHLPHMHMGQHQPQQYAGVPPTQFLPPPTHHMPWG